MSAIRAGQVGWIGTGKMGAPMASHLAAAGVAIQVFDTRPASYAALLGDRVLAADSIEQIGRGCDVVFTSIPDDSVLLSVIEGDGKHPGLAASMARGAILVETSTVSPGASQRASECLVAAGVRYVCAPVSGSTAIAQSGGLTVLASGDRTAWDEVEELLARYSARRFWLGEGDAARYMKLVLNTLVGATASVLGEALLLGERGGLTRADMMNVILESAVSSPLLKYKTDTVTGLDRSPAFRLDQMVKDFSLIIDAARNEDLELEVATLIFDQYQAANAEGRAGEDFFALVDWIGEAATGRQGSAG
ncbi:NAD(P)-dependent oxidoreductase [uncultured Maritimibacter sp.]|jgi:3-hydroxyisobutyrate dehydrogenase|uniref:NAD(P)-dependent oxidoreductase n=1 Tax=uncultured Maritimibacter sp. TaxID=991866 RepID=UPI00260C04FB|nr:NAD(P)-dependent oxidoreductase [uncultured Maritimibacter sp.]